MTKKKKKNEPNYDKLFEALKKFCEKQGVVVPSGESLNLIQFLLELSSKALSLNPQHLKIEADIRKVIAKEGLESESWGGCPDCGSDILISEEECPYCGTSLEVEESEEDDEEDDEEEDDEEEDDEEEEEKPKKSKGKKSKGKKAKTDANGKTAADKRKEREEKRKGIEEMVPKLVKKPAKVDSLKYNELLMLAGVLGSEKPVKIGKTDDLKKWCTKKVKAMAKKGTSSKKKSGKKSKKKGKKKK